MTSGRSAQHLVPDTGRAPIHLLLVHLMERNCLSPAHAQRKRCREAEKQAEQHQHGDQREAPGVSAPSVPTSSAPHRTTPPTSTVWASKTSSLSSWNSTGRLSLPFRPNEIGA